MTTTKFPNHRKPCIYDIDGNCSLFLEKCSFPIQLECNNYMAQSKFKKYFKRCKKCDEFFYTDHKRGKFCSNCKKKTSKRTKIILEFSGNNNMRFKVITNTDTYLVFENEGKWMCSCASKYKRSIHSNCYHIDGCKTYLKENNLTRTKV